MATFSKSYRNATDNVEGCCRFSVPLHQRKSFPREKWRACFPLSKDVFLSKGESYWGLQQELLPAAFRRPLCSGQFQKLALLWVSEKDMAPLGHVCCAWQRGPGYARDWEGAGWKVRVGKISLFKNSTINLERYLRLLGFRMRCQTLKRIDRAEYFFIKVYI